MEENIKYIIESLLFVSEGPLLLDRLKKVLEEADTKEIKQALEDLAQEYEARGGGFMLREVAGGYQIRTRPEYAKWIRLLVQPGTQRLSKASLETLAIIAYYQPIIRADIEFIRGVDCGGVLRMLLEKKLVRVLGRKEIAGRPMIYATTKQFLELFDLKDLKDLPSPKEIEALGNTHALDMEPMDNDAGNDFETTEIKADEIQFPESEDPGIDPGEAEQSVMPDESIDEAITQETDECPEVVIETENPDVSPWDTKGSDDIIEEQPGELSTNNPPQTEDPDIPENDPAE